MFLKSFAQGLKTMAQVVETIADTMENARQPGDEDVVDAEFSPETNAEPEPAAGKKPMDVKKDNEKKEKTVTDIDRVYNIVNRSKNGVSIDALEEKTGFEKKKINSILYKLKKKGKIKNKAKGIYVKA